VGSDLEFSYTSTLKQRLCFAHATHPLMASMGFKFTHHLLGPCGVAEMFFKFGRKPELFLTV
jgi:hypothetical protein